MSAVRLFILVIAAIAAIALAFVVRGAFAPKKAAPEAVAVATPAAAPTVRVLVAKRDLPIGTRLVAGDMGWQDWPAAGLSPLFTTDGVAAAVKAQGAAGAVKDVANAAGGLFGDAAIKSLESAVVREPFIAGEPIVARKIVKAGEGNYMSVVLAPGMRAMSVPVAVDTGAGGFILPGDRVDILLTKAATGDGKGLTTESILRNVRVLAIDQTASAAADAQTLVGAVATLEIAAADTEMIAQAQAAAKAGGTLALALRSYTDAGAPQTRGSSAGRGNGVRVWRAGQASEVMVVR